MYPVDYFDKDKKINFIKDDFFMHAPVGYALHELVFDEEENPCDYRFIAANPAFGSFTGLKISEIIGRTIREVLPGIVDDNFNWIAFYADIATNGLEKAFDQFSASLKKWYRVDAYSPERNFFATLVSPITNEDEMFYEAIDRAGDSIIILDLNASIRYVNTAFVKKTGYSKEEAVGKNINFLNSDIQNDEKFFDEVVQQLETGESWSGITINQTKNGDLLYEETKITPIKDEMGKTVKYIEIKHDMSESYRVKKELVNEKERLEALTKATPDFVCFKDGEGRWLELNKAGQQIFMLSESDYLNKTEEEIVEKADPLLRDTLIFCTSTDKQAWEKGEVLRTVEVIPDMEGNKRYYDVVKCPVFHPNGERKSMIVTGRDLTEQKMAEIKLKEEKELEALLRKKIQAADDTKSAFIAKMSHELRTPLNGIIGFTYLLQSTELSQTQLDFLDNISYSSGNLLDQINKILDFSFIQSGNLNLKKEKIHFEKFIYKIMSLVMEKAEKKGLAVKCIMEDNMPGCIQSDPVILRHVLTNLLHNAIKFTDKGEIGLNIAFDKINKRECELNFTVYDTGIGITEEKQQEIFEAFKQVDNSLTRRYDGTGLGLSIANDLLEKLGTHMAIHSEPMKGSEFSFVLQAEYRAITSDDEKEEQYPNIIESQEKKMKVLIVEDNEVNLKLLRILLTKRYPNVEIFGASNGREGVDSYLKEMPDIILMDIHMPVMDGIMATEKIRELETSRNERSFIIGITAELREDIRRKGFQKGIDDYITKPVDPDLLFRNINKAIAIG